MSDIAIPGVNSKYKSEETVAKLVKAEGTKLDILKKDLEKYQSQKTAWQDLNRTLNQLRTVSRSFYSFESPFNERAAKSSDESSLTAIASREAVEGITRVQILQLAAADRFISKDMPLNARIDPGLYEFKVGDTLISMRYQGGSLKDFADNLSRRADGIIRATVIKAKPDSNVLMIEGLKPGAVYGLQFQGAAVDLGTSLGMIEKSKGSSYPIPEAQKTLTLKPGSSTDLAFSSTTPGNVDLSLELSIMISKDAASTNTPPPLPTGPKLPPAPEAKLRDIRIRDIASDFEVPPYTPPVPGPEVQDPKVLFLKQGETMTLLKEVPDSSEWQTLQIPLPRRLGPGDSLVLVNNNSAKTLSAKEIRVFDPKAKTDYVASNPASSAQDARIKVDGVIIERSTNEIKDVIPGVTLNLQAVSEKPVQVKVEPDRELVKDKLIELMAQYNAVQREINILTARKGTTDVVTELDFLSKEEQKEALTRVGMYQGDSTLSMIKSRLQTITQNAYETRAGREVAVLGNIGISTNSSGAGASGLQASTLRGYLEINEKALDKALSDNFLAVKELFGRDSNGDLVIDNGVGYQIDTFVRPFSQTGGVVINRTNTLDTQIKAKESEIKKFEEYLERYESDLKEKYGKMEGAINQLEASSRDIRNLGNSGNN